MQQFSVLSWNIQGQRCHRSGSTVLPFKKISPALAKNTADIVCLQEIPDAKQKISHLPEFKNFYSFIPELNRAGDIKTHGYGHNIVLSKYPIVAAREIQFPQFKPGVPLENAIKADIDVGGTILRLYNCHLVISGAGMAARLKQLEFVLADCANYNGPIIICGDFNISMPKHGLVKQVVKWWHNWSQEDMALDNLPVREAEKDIVHRNVARHGFKEILDLNQPTWSPLRTDLLELFKLKLDWFLVKNFANAEASVGGYLSDHRPVTVKCQI